MEARVILPLCGDLDGAEAVHQLFRRSVALHFGGYTVTQGVGGWVDPRGALVEEPVAIYDIAVADHKDVTQDDIDIVNFAMGAARELKQEAVYVRLFGGEVEIFGL